MRRCALCPTALSRYNGSRYCAGCERGRSAAALGDQGPLADRLLRFLLGVYAKPEEHDHPSDYAAALTERLDACCEAFGLNPPRLADPFPFRAWAEGVPAGIVVCGEVRDDPAAREGARA